jgi:hypothetical protein
MEDVRKELNETYTGENCNILNRKFSSFTYNWIKYLKTKHQ